MATIPRDDNRVPSTWESESGATKVLDYAHHEVHEGNTFTASYAGDLGNGATVDFLVITPNTTKWAHFIFYIETELEADLLVYEGTAVSANGTAITAYNRNRNSSTTATTLTYHTPTVTTAGTEIRHAHWGSGKSVGGGVRAVEEMILKQNTKYLFRLTNATTSNNYIAGLAIWYEKTFS